MASSAVARALSFIFVIIRSYFKWSSDDTFPVISEGTFFTSNHHIAGLILARGGSKGIPKKNMIDLNGQPLIGWALNAMVDSGVFTSMWVSTDDSETSNWVKKAFPKVRIHERAKYTATDDASSIIAVQEFLSYHPEIDAIGLLQATSPFIQPSFLREAAVVLRKFDSVFSATRSHELRWKASKNPSKEPTVALNFDPKNRRRRQDWDGEMVENGMFYFTMRDVLVNENLFQGKRSTYVEVPKSFSLEIDKPEDLEMAKFIMSQNNIMAKKKFRIKKKEL